jgi:hypothetical protein
MDISEFLLALASLNIRVEKTWDETFVRQFMVSAGLSSIPCFIVPMARA